MKRYIQSAAVAVLSATSAVFPDAGQASVTEDPVISAYFVSWGVYVRDFHVADIPADLITHVNYAFAKPVYNTTNDTGAVVPGDPYADLEKMYPGDTTNQPIRGCFNQLRLLKEDYPHLKALISIGGWTFSADFSDIAASSNARQSFAASCVHFVTNYGFDGVDIDWEFPVYGGAAGTRHRPEDADNLVLLLDNIRDAFDGLEALNGRPYLLTLTGAAPYNSLATRYRLSAVAPLVDWIQVMAYNYSGSWSAKTGHTAPLFENPHAEIPRFNVDETMRAYLAAGVPASKLVLGMPFIAIGLKGVPAIDNGLFQSHGGLCDEGTWNSGFFDYRDLEDGSQGHQYVNANGFVRYWDDASQVPYLYNATSHVFISYEDSASIGLKTTYARSKNLRGVMYWSMNADSEDARLQTMINAMLYPPAISAIRSVVAVSGDGRDVEVEWHARSGQTYGVWFADDLRDVNWRRATWLIDDDGLLRTEVVGSNVTARLRDTNRVVRGFYQLRLPADGVWP